jgi:hypothetical protein
VGGGADGTKSERGEGMLSFFCIHKSRQELTFLAVSWLSFGLFLQVFVYIALELSICLQYTVPFPTNAFSFYVSHSLLFRIDCLSFVTPFLYTMFNSPFFDFSSN